MSFDSGNAVEAKRRNIPTLGDRVNRTSPEVPQPTHDSLPQSAKALEISLRQCRLTLVDLLYQLRQISTIEFLPNGNQLAGYLLDRAKAELIQGRDDEVDCLQDFPSRVFYWCGIPQVPLF